MKKGYKLITAVLAGVAVGEVAFRTTKKKQASAMKEGYHVPYGTYEAFFKRLFDVLFSGIALVVLGPVMVAAALLVRLRLGKPVLFVQERPGKINPETGKEKIFKLYKFRTMTDERNEKGELLADEDRLPTFGQKLRSTSLDELPELFNILKGDMSLIGPRPLLVEYLPRYSPAQRRRHEVLPGLTGLSQSRGRNARTWEERFRDDVEYVDRITFWGDVNILLDTVKVVLSHKGINSGTSVTMEEFKGK